MERVICGSSHFNVEIKSKKCQKNEKNYFVSIFLRRL